MSILITTDIECDEPDCPLWTNGAYGSRILKREARDQAAEDGWAYAGGKDYCPEHAAAHGLKPNKRRTADPMASWERVDVHELRAMDKGKEGGE